MKIKTLLTKLLPSYRTTNIILEKLNSLDEKIDGLYEKENFYFWLLAHKDDENFETTKSRIFSTVVCQEEEIVEIQSALLIMLNRIKRICDENNIKFFLYGGSVLGAIRHKGIIPWDDDIDIGLMKNDYEKFKNLINKDELLQINMYYSYSGNGSYNVIKITTKKYDNLFIDVFLFDYIDSENIEISKKEILNQIDFYKDKLQDMLSKRNLKNSIKPIKDKKSDLLLEKIIKETYAMNRKWGYGKYICECVEHIPINRIFIFNKDDVIPFEEVEFSGTKQYIWKNAEAFLSLRYGNYNDFPKMINSTHVYQLSDKTKEEIEYLKNQINYDN